MLALASFVTVAQEARPPANGLSPSAAHTVRISAGPDGRLIYTADARGTRVIDFSHAGYGGGGVAIPDVPARLVVAPGQGHDLQRIQAALDAVGAMTLDRDGLRGAVLLEAGTYEIEGALRIAASGVVLRGSGRGPDGTTLVATGTSRRALLTLAGTGERTEIADSQRSIADAYLPVGARSFTVAGGNGFRVGDRVVVRRPSTKAWIAQLGMDTFAGWRPENRLHWQPGSRDITWDRVVTAVDGLRLTVDAPLTTALDAELGGGSITRYEFTGRIRRAGVENLRLVSAYDTTRPLDEDHAWDAVALDKVEDAWVRQVTAEHFVNHVVDVQRAARAVTVEDVEALDPVSEVGGWRRRVFHTEGELTLFQRCRSRAGKHDFVAGHAAAGPNVFLDSSTDGSLDFSGPLGSWASGVLYDNVVVRGNAVRLLNRGVDDQGAGWAAANSIVWNAEATDIEVHSSAGRLQPGLWRQGRNGRRWDRRGRAGGAVSRLLPRPARAAAEPLSRATVGAARGRRGRRHRAAHHPARREQGEAALVGRARGVRRARGRGP